MMKSQSANEMINVAVEEIEKIAPKHSEIEIDVKEDPVGHFSTHIKLITKKRVYFAKKDGSYLYKSFNKALKAIKSQLPKKKHYHSGLKFSEYEIV